MYKPIVLLLILLCIVLWGFTYISNNNLFGVENFMDLGMGIGSDDGSDNKYFPGVKTDYIKQFKDDLTSLSKRVANPEHSAGGKQIKNIVDTLREFALSKLDKSSINEGLGKIEKNGSYPTRPQILHQTQITPPDTVYPIWGNV